MGWYAFFANVRGNAPILERFFHCLEQWGVEGIYLLGDGVGVHSGNQRCLRLLRERHVVYLRGDWEDRLLSAAQSGWLVARQEFTLLQEVLRQLDEEDLEYLEGLPYVVEGTGFQAAHASLISPSTFPSLEIWDHAKACLEQLREPVFFFGQEKGGAYFQADDQLFSLSHLPREVQLHLWEKVLLPVGDLERERRFLLWNREENLAQWVTFGT